MERALIDRDERVHKAEAALEEAKTRASDAVESASELRVRNTRLEDELKDANDRVAIASYSCSIGVG